ncbi:Sec-independent protein translocase subunit TatA [Kitasatospora sp. CM 4170]|uniref:Sec-independent protein translocase protein TatA n=1 Tax=Kitasatospora aburaviensis TaxID=67265 RepID=A0ABW1F6H7_9ACTN|nr:Sec-independent protein translocase subunit TatA [Kitasatospora sp. CM 4170]WNM49160.1 Sec-independent protein translocase subunit TatA [Kitasatospora sp. CM 4170]
MLRNGLEPWHLLVVVAVVVLLFGSKKLPDMARGLGKSMRILKAETAAMREAEAPPAAGDTAAEHPRSAAPPAPPAGTPAPSTAAAAPAGADRTRRTDPPA